MEYYLETNALYQIKKIPDSILRESFYSALSFVELIGGINSENFTKRKSLLLQIINSNATFYYYFPEDCIWASFTYFQSDDSLKRKYEISKVQGELLIVIANEIFASDSYEQFIKLTDSKYKEYDFQYFQKVDNHYTENFSKATIAGNEEISKILEGTNGKKPSITLDNQKYDLSSRKAINKFLHELPLLNAVMTINACANDAMNSICHEQNEQILEQIHDSYNGTADIYINAFSKYTTQKMVDQSTPSRNDLQDLLHLAYLRNSNNVVLVSNDKIFKQYIPEFVKSIEDLIS